jgi:hypothetical protein
MNRLFLRPGAYNVQLYGVSIDHVWTMFLQSLQSLKNSCTNMWLLLSLLVLLLLTARSTWNLRVLAITAKRNNYNS